MLSFRRVKIQNFVGLADIEVKFSTEVAKPLTVIRAENGSGKTTFLRALAWCLYGEPAVPYPGATWPLQTIDWDPDQGEQQVQVSIEFTTDASGKADGKGAPVRYELTRSVMVVPRPGTDPNWARRDERVRLMRHTPGAGWDEQPGAIRMIEELIPWELREFFFTDADKAEDFLGGREGGEQLTHSQLVERTTGAVRALLSLDILRDAAARAEKRADAYRKRLSKSTGDREIAELQANVEKKKSDRDQLRGTTKELNEQLSNLRDSLEAANASLETALRGSGAYEELAHQMESNRVGIQKATEARKALAARASDALGEPLLFAGLVHKSVCRVHDVLEPLEQQGLIPLRHLPFVRDRLEHGACICGTDISTPGKARDAVERLITDSEEREKKANFLGDVFNESRYFRGLATEPATFWPDRVRQVIDDLGMADEELSGLERQKEELQKRLSGIKLDLVEELKRQIGDLESEVERKELKARKSEADLDDLEDEIESLSKTLSALTRKHALDKDALKAMAAAEDATALMRRTYRRVATDQIAALSDRMNSLFRDMIAAASDEVIHRVGIKESAPEEYEIFAEKRNGDPLHVATMVNGASRRALAMAFIVALAEQSGTRAPTVCDSLLNNTSSSVREGTFSVTVNNSSQPVLLMTRDEIHGVEQLIRERAGEMYTLTAQWQADPADGRAGEVVRRTVDRPVAVLCTCAIDEYCTICERRHDREDGSLRRRSA